MSDSEDDRRGPSLHIMQAMGVKLISPTAAVMLAEHIVRDRYGRAELERQLPLHVVADGDFWLVTGSYDPGSILSGPGELRPGRVKLVISQSDGRVTDLVFTGGLPRREGQL